MAKDAYQSRAGVSHWWLHAIRQQLRCADLRMLQWRKISICRPNPQRLHAHHTAPDLQATEAFGDRTVPVRKPARSEIRQMGRGSNSGENEGLSMGEAGPR